MTGEIRIHNFSIQKWNERLNNAIGSSLEERGSRTQEGCNAVKQRYPIGGL